MDSTDTISSNSLCTDLAQPAHADPQATPHTMTPKSPLEAFKDDVIRYLVDNTPQPQEKAGTIMRLAGKQLELAGKEIAGLKQKVALPMAP